jgi:radical SAM superfamily enzyme YgiQ (UPF0313 family)
MARHVEAILNRRKHGLAISVGSSRVYTFDREGRPYHAMLEGATYVRGLDNTLLQKTRDANGVRRRTICTAGQSLEVLNTIWSQAKSCRDALSTPVDDEGADQRSLREEDLEALNAVLHWTPEKLSAEKARFYDVYNPIGVLPPDQYRSIVVQASEGCSWNRCTFCTLYRDREFRIKDEPQLRQHIENIKALHGKALADRKSIFIGDANALTIPHARLHRSMEIIREAFPEQANALHSFLDIFSSLSKDTDYFEQLRRLGLKKVYIGLESGSEELLRFLDKPVEPKNVIPLVKNLKDAGINVAVIIMAGIGGHRFAEGHRRDTIDVLSKLPLDLGDQIYISALTASEKMPYLQVAENAGIEPMTAEELAEQVDYFRRSLQTRFTSAKISTYDLAEFIY